MTNNPKSKTGQIKVHLRSTTLMHVSPWLENEFNTGFDRNKLQPDMREFFDSLIKKGAMINATDTCLKKRFDLDRKFAEQFVVRTLHWLDSNHPRLLLKRTDYVAGNGLTAIAEIAMDIKVALERKEGRPLAIDPLHAYELNEREKATHKRACNNSHNINPSHEIVANNLGVTKNTLYSAISKGRDAAKTIAEARSSLPSDANPLFALVDSEAKTVELIAAKKIR